MGCAGVVSKLKGIGGGRGDDDHPLRSLLVFSRAANDQCRVRK